MQLALGTKSVFVGVHGTGFCSAVGLQTSNMMVQSGSECASYFGKASRRSIIRATKYMPVRSAYSHLDLYATTASKLAAPAR